MSSILIIGATGLVGAPLTREIRKAYPDWSVTVYVRNTQVDEYLKSNLGANRIVHGTFEESEKIRALAKEHEFVINAGSSFDPTLSAAIIAGLEERPAESKGTLIHISGGGNFIDRGTTGVANPSGKVWNDASEDDIQQIDERMLNGAADKLVLDAGNSGAINTFIVCLAGTYGAYTGPSPTLGVFYAIVVGNSKALGFVPYVGEGSNIFCTIHIDDAVPFIMKILNVAITEPATGSAYSRYYIIHGQANTWKEIASAIAPVLHAKGVIPSPVPRSVPIEEAGEGEVPMLLGANMLIKGDRAAALGFKPTARPFLEHIREDLANYPF